VKSPFFFIFFFHYPTNPLLPSLKPSAKFESLAENNKTQKKLLRNGVTNHSVALSFCDLSLMGVCTSKPQKPNPYALREAEAEGDPSQIPKAPLSPAGADNHRRKDDVTAGKQSPFFPFYSPSPARFLKKSPAPAGGSRSAASTPRRFFRRPFPPPSPAKHIRAVLARRQGKKAAAAAAISEEGEDGDGAAADLDKRFGFSKEFTSRLEVGEEVGRGHFGYTCSARFKKGELKGQQVAVKVIPKAKVSSFHLQS